MSLKVLYVPLRIRLGKDSYSLFKTSPRKLAQFVFVKNETVRFENTFNYRILQHFKNDPLYQTHEVSQCSVQTFSVDHLKKELDNNEHLKNLALPDLLDRIIIIGNSYDYDFKFLKRIDEECSQRLCSGLCLEDTLKVLDALIYLSPHRLAQMQSFSMCLDIFSQLINSGKEMSIQQLVQSLFYVSLIKDKKSVRKLNLIVTKKLARQFSLLDKFNPFELAIFCNSLYKTGTKLENKPILKELVKSIDKNMQSLFSKPELFTSVIKPLQQAKYNDYELLDKLSEMLLENKLKIGDMNQIGDVYLLKLYANGLYKNEKTILLLADTILKSFDHSFEKDKPFRVKDVAVVLKAFCELGFDSLKTRVTELLNPKIVEMFNYDIPYEAQRTCLEIILWLNVLGVCPRDVIEKFVNPSTLDKGKAEKLKHLARINLLLTILSIEHPDILMKNNVPNLRDNIFSSDIEVTLSHPELVKVYDAVKFLAASGAAGIRSYRCAYVVPNIFIQGIVIETNRSTIAVELLGEKACLHNSGIPHGYMKLKLRLLNKMNFKVILISQEDLHAKYEDLMVKIEDEIQRIDNF